MPNTPIYPFALDISVQRDYIYLVNNNDYYYYMEERQLTKHSRQRECIKEFLATRYDHPTAEIIYLNVKEKFPNLSLGTVYRNLSLLTELGEIQKLSTGIESRIWRLRALTILIHSPAHSLMVRLRGTSPTFLVNVGIAWKIKITVDKLIQLCYLNISNNYCY